MKLINKNNKSFLPNSKAWINYKLLQGFTTFKCSFALKNFFTKVGNTLIRCNNYKYSIAQLFKINKVYVGLFTATLRS